MEFLDFSDSSRRREYDLFLRSHPAGSFTQSLGWCGVKSGWKHAVILVRDSRGQITASMLVLIRSAPLLHLSFLYSPRGPVCDFSDKAVLAELMEGVRVLAEKYHAFLFKCDPFVSLSDQHSVQNFIDAGLTLRPDPEENTTQCRCNYQLDIRGKTADEIFRGFHPKWRYNIRLAERKGVVCQYYTAQTLASELDEFYALMRETGKRDGFNIRPEAYFRSMLTRLYPNCRLYLCRYNGKAVSGAVCVQYAGKTCYVYGASSSEYRSAMPNYLMQWNMIRWAVESRDSVYDFQGIPHYRDESHPNYGVYRFKKGFGGEVTEYAGEFCKTFHPRTEAAARAVIHLYLKQSQRIQRCLEVVFSVKPRIQPGDAAARAGTAEKEEEDASPDTKKLTQLY